MTKSGARSVRRYVASLQPGVVFTPAELVRLRIGSERAVREELRRLADAGRIRRLSKGYYDVPRTNSRIGLLSPTPEAIVTAHARKTGGTIARPEVEAVNALGLTTQVLALPVYRTNLFPRDLNIGRQRIRLRATGPRTLAPDAEAAELVIDALQALGKNHIVLEDIAKLREFVRTQGLAKKLKRRAHRASAWMIPFIDAILAEV